MNDDSPNEHDDLLRAALHAEADGIEASPELLDRTLAAAARPPVRPARRVLVAAAVIAAVAVGAGVAVALDDGNREVDAIDDPTTTTTTEHPDETGDALAALFPCQQGDVQRLSLFVDADGVDAVQSAITRDPNTLELDRAPASEVEAALAGKPQDGVLPVALSATFANGEDELEVRGRIADLPGVIALSTTECGSGDTTDAPRPTIVALVREDGWLVVIDLETGDERELHFVGDPNASGDVVEEGGPYFIDAVDLSPDGQWVYFSTCCEPASGNTYRIAIGGGEPELFAVGAYPRVSPDSRFVATGAGTVVIVTPVDGSNPPVEVPCCTRSMAWSPDGSQLAVVHGTGAPGEPSQVLLFDWHGTSLRPADMGKPDNPGAFVSWMPSGVLNIVSGGPVDDDRGLSQDTSYQWILWVDEEGVVREQAGFESSDRTPIQALPEALAADW